MGPGLIPKPIAIAIAVIITVVWAASQLGSLFVAGYQAPEGIHAALMIVLGAVFALRRSDDKPDKPDDDPPDRPTPPAVAEVDDEARAAAQTLIRLHPETAAELIARLRREREGDQ